MPSSVNLLTEEEAAGLLEQADFIRAKVNPTLKNNHESSVNCDFLFDRLMALPGCPRFIYPPRLNRYSKGEYYKAHTDSPFMELPDGRIRTDMSLTIWLTDDYEGGELLIDGIPYKGKVGEGVLYSGSTIHEVKPVIRGERVCLITWIQSEIRDPEIREIVQSLSQVRRNHYDPLLDNAIARLVKLHVEI